MLVKKEEKK